MGEDDRTVKAAIRGRAVFGIRLVEIYWFGSEWLGIIVAVDGIWDRTVIYGDPRE